MKASNYRWVLPVLALAMTGLGFYHVDRTSQEESQSVPRESPARSPYDDAIAASGVVEARSENIAIGAALSGIVLDVFVPSNQVGMHVKTGQALFRVDDRHLKAQLKVAEARLALAESQLARLTLQPRPEEIPPSLAKVKAAAANTARLRDLHERSRRLVSSGAVPQEENVTRQREFETAEYLESQTRADHELLMAGAWQPDINIATATVNEARAEVEQVQIEISRATVVSPVDGVVLQVNVRPGERVSEMDGKALFVLGDLNTYHVRVDIDEREIGRFQRGARATAFPRGDTSLPVAMRFSRVEPLVIPKRALTGDNTERVDTRVLQVLYAIERTEQPVYVGQQLDVFIDGGTSSGNGHEANDDEIIATL